MTIRRGESGDLAEIRAIQAASPQAAQWEAADYLKYDLLVAVDAVQVFGFLVCRTLAPGESELLTMAVAPEFRRQGVGRALLGAYLEALPGAAYLEVRASNQAARSLYKSLGFQDVAVREEYYEEPSESAIVMKFHSC